jgi:hypothetical protein
MATATLLIPRRAARRVALGRTISSVLSLRSTAAAASSRWCGLVAPTMGAVTTGLCNSYANASCAGGTPRSFARSARLSMTRWSAAAVSLP